LKKNIDLVLDKAAKIIGIPDNIKENIISIRKNMIILGGFSPLLEVI